jgi:hypothetical protein
MIIYRVRPKADGTFAIQEWVRNTFCGDWHEIDWALDIGTANAIVEAAS